jgi:hypothetical protein
MDEFLDTPGMGIKNKNALNNKVVGADEAYGSLFLPTNFLLPIRRYDFKDILSEWKNRANDTYD